MNSPRFNSDLGNQYHEHGKEPPGADAIVCPVARSATVFVEQHITVSDKNVNYKEPQRTRSGKNT